MFLKYFEVLYSLFYGMKDSKAVLGWEKDWNSQLLKRDRHEHQDSKQVTWYMDKTTSYCTAWVMLEVYEQNCFKANISNQYWIK